MSLCTSSSIRNAARASLILSTWQPRRTSSCASTMPVWKSALRHSIHSKTPHKIKLTANSTLAGDTFFSSLFCCTHFQSRKFCGTFFFLAIDFCLQDSFLIGVVMCLHSSPGNDKSRHLKQVTASHKSNILLCLKSKGFEFLSAIHLSLMKHLL